MHIKYLKTVTASIVCLLAFTNQGNAAITLSDASIALTTNLATSTAITSSNISGSASLTFTLDLNKSKDYFSNLIGSPTANNKPTLVSITSGTGTIGTGVGYSSSMVNGVATITQAGVFATTTAASTTSQCGDYFGGQTIFNNLNWDNVAAISCTVSHEDKSGTTLYSLITFNDGTTTQFNGTKNTSLKWGAGMGTFNNLNINTDLVSSVYIFNQSLTADQAQFLNAQAASIPEPSTATLGLLGLSALMLRRRRRV